MQVCTTLDNTFYMLLACKSLAEYRQLLADSFGEHMVVGRQRVCIALAVVLAWDIASASVVA